MSPKQMFSRNKQTMNNIIENNKLIAKFMELKPGVVSLLTPDFEKWLDNNDGKYYADDELNYHKLWDRLIPVVKKIESLEKLKTSESPESSCVISINHYTLKGVKGKLKTIIYEAVLQFIKSYNSNNQKKVEVNKNEKDKDYIKNLLSASKIKSETISSEESYNDLLMGFIIKQNKKSK